MQPPEEKEKEVMNPEADDDDDFLQSITKVSKKMKTQEA